MGKITVSAKGDGFALLVPQQMFKELGLDQKACYELARAKEGIWVLVKEEKLDEMKRREKPVAENPLDKKIFALLKKKDLKDRVEKRFETFLSKEALVRFGELLKEGKVIAFRLSPKYKRAVYKTREEIEKNVKMNGETGNENSENENPKGENKTGVGKVQGKKEPETIGTGKKEPETIGTGKKESESFNAKEKRPDEYTLEKDGFLVFKNAENAKILSIKLKKEIDDGKIRGIKSFDGFYYIVQNELYQKYRTGVLSAIKEKANGVAGIGEQIGISKMLAKVVCELLKYEGEIIEKRKDKFQTI